MSTVEFSHIASTYIENMDGLYAYALHMGFNDQTSMDAIHDVFYKLCIRHSSLDEIENLKSYLFRALRNRLVDLKRSNREIPSLFTANEKNEEILSFNLNVTVEDELILKEDSDEIRRKVETVLNRLTHRQREIIYLRYIQECSYDEISDIMNISIAASRNLVNRSFVKLKEAMLTISLFIFIIK